MMYRAIGVVFVIGGLLTGQKFIAYHSTLGVIASIVVIAIGQFLCIAPERRMR